jgi:phosphatidate cytidylyltransferase
MGNRLKQAFNTDNLLKRISFAAWAIPIGWWVINSTIRIGPPGHAILPGQLAAIALVAVCLHEYLQLTAMQYSKNTFWIVQVWLLLQLGCEAFGVKIPLTFSIFVLLTLVLIETLIWGRNDEGRLKRASLVFIGGIFLYISGSSLLSLYDISFKNIFVMSQYAMLSQLGVALFAAAVFMCDTAAYFVGIMWGKHKYPIVSPDKTIEGSVAGLVAATVIFSTGWFFVRQADHPHSLGIFLGLASGFGAIGGDLIVSLIKRHFRVKDSSNIIPGHGGFLDRFGSLFFAAPCVCIVVWVMR